MKRGSSCSYSFLLSSHCEMSFVVKSLILTVTEPNYDAGRLEGTELLSAPDPSLIPLLPVFCLVANK